MNAAPPRHLAAARPPAALELRRVSKSFGPVLANDEVSFVVAAGTIHSLLGENGAGKTTAMRIAFGLHAPDRGEVMVDGRLQRFAGPRDAIRCGIGMVHQHFTLVETMTVTENVVLGAEPGRWWAVDRVGGAARIAALSRQLALEVDLAAQVSELSVGERQRVEVLKALYRRARLLILDEPTAVLESSEVAALFKILRQMREQGRTTVLITQRLSEALAIADSVTVMRGGRVVADRATCDTTAAELVRLIVGGEELPRFQKAVANPGEPVLAVRELAVTARGAHALHARRNRIRGVPLSWRAGLCRGLRLAGVSFQVRAGEIVGIVGVEGSGQFELIEALAGLADAAAVSGRIIFVGCDLPLTGARRRRELGIAHIPEDRQRRGLLLDFDLTENTILGVHFRPPAAIGPLHLWLDRSAIARRAAALLARFEVRPARLEMLASALSGGNQTKLVLAREMSLSPRLLLAAHPTRGVDVGGMALIHQEILALRDAGCAVLLVSSELKEVMALADRLLVLHRGKVAGEVDPARATPEEIELLMTGEIPA